MVALTDEVSSQITNWAVVAESYESKTEMTVAVLVPRCQDKMLYSMSITTDR